MDTLEKIESELKEISKWPWRANHHSVFNGPELHDVLLSADNAFADDDYSNFTEQDATFIALAPERIAALVELARAAEGLYALTKACGWTVPNMAAYEQARAKLGLK